MIVHRFMSDREYKRLMAGKTLTNTTIHASKHRESTSVGFCFFTEPPKDAIKWLAGIVDTDWLVTFDISEQMLTKSMARYRDTEKDKLILGEPITKLRTEWCLKEYSTSTVRIVNVTEQWANYIGKADKAAIRILEALLYEAFNP